MKQTQLSFILALICTLLIAVPASASNRYINVTGDGQVEAWPDFLTIQILISAEDKTASTAKSKVDKSMNALLDLSQELNIKKKDIEAARLTNQPVFDWIKNERVLRGERVSRNVVITLRQLDQHSELLHKLLQQHNIQIQHSQSGFDDPASLSLQATNLALQQAKQKAESMASTLGIRLGKVLSIDEQGQQFAPLRTEARMFSMSADNTQSQPAPMILQKETIKGSVQVRFELK